MLPADFDMLVGELQMEFPALSSEAILRFLQRSAIRFCRLSGYWHMDLAPVTILEGETVYPLSAGKHYAILDILSVSFNGLPVQRYGGSGVRTWQQTGAGEITLTNFTVGDIVYINASIAPHLVDGEIKLPPAMQDEYAEALMDGARAMAYKMPKEWHNLGLHQLHEEYFLRASSSARLKQASDYATASTQERPFTPQRFF